MNRLTWILVLFFGPICCCLRPVLQSELATPTPESTRKRVSDVIFLSPPTMTPSPEQDFTTGRPGDGDSREPSADRSSKRADSITRPAAVPPAVPTAPPSPPPLPTAAPVSPVPTAIIPTLEPPPVSTPLPTPLPPTPPPSPPDDDDDDDKDDDDDGPDPSPTPTPDLPVVSFSLPAYTVREEEGVASITIVLDKLSARVVTINYITGDDAAVAPDDYARVSGSLTFSPGETIKTFAVPIVADSLAEPDEALDLTLSHPAGAVLGSLQQATLTILDDDQGPVIPVVQFSLAGYRVSESDGMATITVVLDKPSSQIVRVDYTAGDNTATAGSDYTIVVGTLAFNPGETSKSFPVIIRNDQVVEPDESLFLTLSQPTGAALGAPQQATLTILDDDQPSVQFASVAYSVVEGSAAGITVTLTAAPAVTVTVEYVVSDGTATAVTDYAPLTGTIVFSPGETGETFTILSFSDLANEFDETVLLALKAPTNAVLGAPAKATLTIEDLTDSVVEFDKPAYFVVEDDDATVNPVPITVTLSPVAPTTVTVAYNTTELTASAGQDYIDTSGTLTFPPGRTSLTFTVTISEDGAAEPDETIFLNLQNPSSEAILGAGAAAVLTIVDDGDTSLCSFSPGTTELTPDIGPPDGEFAPVACHTALVVDLGGKLLTTTGGPAFDFVFYEVATSTTGIQLNRMTVKVAKDKSGPWYEVFHWGDATTDLNTNIGQAGYGPASSPPVNVETSPEDIPTTVLDGPPPLNTGVAVNIDAVAPAGPYRYLRFEALPNVANKGVEIDAVENLP